MSFFKRTIGLWAVSKTAHATTPLFMALLMGMAVLTLVGVIGSVLVAMFLMGGIWFVYTQMVTYGTDPATAKIILAILLIFLLSFAILIGREYVRRLKADAERLVYLLQMPLLADIPEIIESFINGLWYKSKKPE